MTEYLFHWWPSGTAHASAESVRLQAASDFHGAALALRHFSRHGCDLTAPSAHIDMTGPDGAKRTLLVDEVIHWLEDPEQTDLLEREDLAVLLR